VPPHREEAVGRADLVGINQVSMFLDQREGEGRVGRVVGHARVIGLPEVIDLSFDDQFPHLLGQHVFLP
jgi:hypothetical protein